MKIPDRFVVDASIAVAWAIASEATQLTEALFDRLRASTQAFAPAIWPTEVANALLMAERAGRISPAQVSMFGQLIDRLAISIDTAKVFDEVLAIARQLRLSAYDASYLELALRNAQPLATLDKQMARAAQSLGIAVLS